MRAEIRVFKKMLEEIIIPETLLPEERNTLLNPLLEYVNNITPSRLFRYRECSERQFDAFFNDRIYAVNARLFNDPYDCLIRYNKDYLYNSIIEGASKEYIKQLRDRLRSGESIPNILISLCGKERADALANRIKNLTDVEIDGNKLIFNMSKEDFFNRIEKIFQEAETFLRRSTFIACFSETVRSVTMWSHYADSHKGFVLEYNVKNMQTECDICNDRQKCGERIIHELFPIIYDNKRYDGTSFVDYYLGQKMGLFTKLNDIMFNNKAALYKSPQWQYEKEWRLFLYQQNSSGLPYLFIKLKPVAIFYGKDISSINKKILSDMAKAKGIKEYQMYIDVQSDKYSMQYKRI